MANISMGAVGFGEGTLTCSFMLLAFLRLVFGICDFLLVLRLMWTELGQKRGWIDGFLSRYWKWLEWDKVK